MNKKLIFIIVGIVIVLAVSLICFFSCNNEDDETSTSNGVTTDIEKVEFSDEDITETYSENSLYSITFSGSAIEAAGSTVSDNVVIVTKAGEYIVSGSSTNARIVVDCAGTGTVRLILNGLALTSADYSPICVLNAEKVIITVNENTVNTLTDAASYTVDTEATAAIYSKSDLTINGAGSLVIDANYNNAIQCKDTLKILSANFNITSVDDGIIGKDNLAIASGTFVLNVGGDGFVATNDTETALGNIIIESGTFDITSGADGIQATGDLLIENGSFDITAGGGGATTLSSSDTGSYKGLKATGDIEIVTGVFAIDSKDDNIHSNANLKISDGTFTLRSGDDGIHSDTALEIAGGTITITKSYEGIESCAITINGGTIKITSSDDGMNSAGGSDGSSTQPRPGQNTFNPQQSSSSNYNIYINGGYIYVNAAGDGVDANGSITMTAGTLLVDGPTDNGNGAMDYDGSFTMNGGLLVAVGSSGMAQAPSAGSSNYAMIKLNYSKSGSFIHIEDSDGNTVLNYKPSKTYQSIVIAGDFDTGSHKLYLDGTITGTSVFGLYSNAETYTGGTLSGSFTVN